MTLSENEIHIYRTSLETSPDSLKEYEIFLSPDELAKANRYKFEKDRIHYITGRAYLRIILGNYLNQSPADINFSYTNKGKPFIINSNVKFNLAHSGGRAVYAFTKNNELGIDIEYMRELPDAVQIANRFFSADEVIEFSEVNARDVSAAFFNCWTRKEAFIKAVGEGLSYPLKDFTVTLKPGDKPELKWIKDKPDEVNEWKLFNLDEEINYVASLAVKFKDVKIIYSSLGTIN